MRQLATIRRIEEIKPITGADRICAYRVGGWWVVDSVGKYAVNDLAIYFEVDSFLPHSLAPFLTKGDTPREFNGVKGERLRTIRLKKQISQGLLTPVQHNSGGLYWITNKNGTMNSVIEGDNVTDALGIQKWEPPMPLELAGQVEGPFPSYIPRTDQERAQNLYDEIFVQNADAHYEVTIKLDGTSCTIFHRDGTFGVCSRNYHLKINEANKNNALVQIAHDTLLNVYLPQMGNYAVQGELIGPKIQNNQERLTQTQFYIFDVYSIGQCRHLTASEREDFSSRLFSLTNNGNGRMFHVPIVTTSANLKDTLGVTNMEQLLKFAEGPSLNAAQREGLVFKAVDREFTFKAISNRWLLENDV